MFGNGMKDSFAGFQVVVFYLGGGCGDVAFLSRSPGEEGPHGHRLLLGPSVICLVTSDFFVEVLPQLRLNGHMLVTAFEAMVQITCQLRLALRSCYP